MLTAWPTAGGEAETYLCQGYRHLIIDANQILFVHGSTVKEMADKSKFLMKLANIL
jgi:hypothetical protein